MKNLSHSVLVISLDFELHWGRFDTCDLESQRKRYINTKSIIPRLLSTFESYDIQATWAIVGALFAENWEEWEFYNPQNDFSFTNSNINQDWINKNKADENCFFAPNEIRQIIESNNQEIGSHTFSHFLTKSNGVRNEEFKADLLAAKKIAKDKFNLEMSSLVFPRNQYDQNTLNLAFESGFKIVRTNPAQWYWQNTHHDHSLKKVIRTLNSFLSFDAHQFSQPQLKNNLVEIPSSNFLKPVGFIKSINNVRIQKIIADMNNAAQKNQVYHLWWHPHNFGNNTEENFYMLNVILKQYKFLENKYGMKSFNMNKIAFEISKNNPQFSI